MLPIYGEVSIEEGIYEAADEMMRFDNKLNRLIAEHNGIDLDDEDVNIINDFEETKNGYRLIENIDNKSQVVVSLKNRVLTITIVKSEKSVTLINGEESYEITKSESQSSLFLPSDADEESMQKEYRNGILKIEFLKK